MKIYIDKEKMACVQNIFYLLIILILPLVLFIILMLTLVLKYNINLKMFYCFQKMDIMV
jgi:hypothetical protein